MSAWEMILTDFESDVVSATQASFQPNFEEIFAMHHRIVYRYACALTRDGALAEDIVQEVFIRLYKNPGATRNKVKPKQSSLPSGEPGETPSVASTAPTGDRNESGVLDGETARHVEKARPFKELAHSFVSGANPITAPDERMRKLEEIHREYRLSPGARGELSNINGPVEIETADTDTAEVHITRFAQGLADVYDSRLKIVDTPNSLTILAEGNSLRMGGNEARHRVALKIPRRVDLTIKHVSDRLKVGEIDGSIHLNGLSWKAEMELPQF